MFEYLFGIDVSMSNDDVEYADVYNEPQKIKEIKSDARCTKRRIRELESKKQENDVSSISYELHQQMSETTAHNFNNVLNLLQDDYHDETLNDGKTRFLTALSEEMARYLSKNAEDVRKRLDEISTSKSSREKMYNDRIKELKKKLGGYDVLMENYNTFKCDQQVTKGTTGYDKKFYEGCQNLQKEIDKRPRCFN